MLNKFWWCSNSNDSEGINWLSWSAMSMTKVKGGLGFRDLYGFNVALIGKLCWNFIKNPQKLVSRVFKIRYYPNSDFLKATLGNKVSFAWRGIVTTRDSLTEGYRWIIGNWNDIDIVRDPWLHGKHGYKVDQNLQYNLLNNAVSSFMVADSTNWDDDKVSNVFNEVDSNVILSTRIPHTIAQDWVAWTKNS